MEVALSIRTDMVSALFLGGFLGVLTFAVPSLAVISTNPTVAMLQKVAFFMLLPGLFIAIATSGNTHAFYLWVAAIGNFFFYSVIVWFPGVDGGNFGIGHGLKHEPSRTRYRNALLKDYCHWVLCRTIHDPSTRRDHVSNRLCHNIGETGLNGAFTVIGTRVSGVS